MARDVAPVVAAEMLLRHGMAEDLVAAYAARTFSLDAASCRAVLTAAHILLRREMREEAATPFFSEGETSRL